MKRRAFIAGLAGAAAWPLAARAQQPERVRRIGVLTSSSMQDLATQARFAALQQGLQQLGFDRWSWNDAAGGRRRRQSAQICGRISQAWAGRHCSNPARPALLLRERAADQVPRTSGSDRRRSSMNGRRANVTGFMLFEYGTAAKWPELLKQIART
jgi:putative ABC transport system substrate-binding protein